MNSQTLQLYFQNRKNSSEHLQHEYGYWSETTEEFILSVASKYLQNLRASSHFSFNARANCPLHLQLCKGHNNQLLSKADERDEHVS
jgi:hypothetical protein